MKTAATLVLFQCTYLATTLSRQRWPSLLWRKVILIYFLCFFPLPKGQTIRAVPSLGSIRRGNEPLFTVRLQPWAQPAASTPNRVRSNSQTIRNSFPGRDANFQSSGRPWELWLFKCHTECGNFQPFFENYRRQHPIFNQYEVAIFTAFFFPLKCSPICNTQDRTNFCPSKTVVTAVIFTRAIKFQTGWIIFVPGRKNIWPSSGPRGKKKAGFIVLYPFLQHTVALLGW